MESLQKISGFPEYLPLQQQAFQKVIAKIQKIFEDFCAFPIATPAVERLETLVKKGGNHKEIYTLGRLGENQKAALGLKFDLTVPLARYVSQHFEHLTFPFRRYQIQPVWRGERAQRGRYRQFYQCDFDVVGNQNLSHYYDAEVLLLAYKIMEELGVKNYSMRFNHRKVLKGVLLYFGVALEQLEGVFRILDKKQKISQEKFQTELAAYIPANRIPQFQELFDETTNEQLFQKLEKIVDIMKKENHSFFVSFQSALLELQSIYKIAQNFITHSQKLFFDLSIVRGLEYYTGMIFETSILDCKELGSVCSGGRYSDLASHFGKRKLPGVGFSIGISRLFNALVLDNTASPQKLLIAFLEEKYLQQVFSIADKIRKIGIPTEVFLEKKKIITQIQYAEKQGYQWLVFYAEEEEQHNAISIKDLQTKEQKMIPITELEHYFSEFQQ